MRKFTCAPFGDIEVDLDDQKTYEHLPKTARELDDRMMMKIGQFYCYVEYWHKDVFKNNQYGQVNDQKKRCWKLIEAYTKGRRNNWENPMWFAEQVFRFEDEIENMC